MITDLKTTPKFDQFSNCAVNALRFAVSSLHAGGSIKRSSLPIAWLKPFAPYRVQFMIAGIDFVETGERKLRTCVDEIIKVWRQRARFLIEEVGSWATGPVKKGEYEIKIRPKNHRI